MQTLDEDLWQTQQAELKEDRVGQAFLDFILDWTETAEKGMEKDPDLSPIEAIRASLIVTEEKHGRISASFVGQMMVVIISHWIHGHQVSAEFTPIEHRLMEDMLILKLRELRDAAELTPDTDPNVTAIHQD